MAVYYVFSMGSGAEDEWVACRITVKGRHKAQPPIPFDSGISSSPS
jgi:hypothetical protein